MNWQALWFVLAGLILGFALSTLWEWLYFRRVRLPPQDKRVADLERQLRLAEQRNREDHAVGYQSPGVLLESEQAEDLLDLSIRELDENLAPEGEAAFADDQSDDDEAVNLAAALAVGGMAGTAFATSARDADDQSEDPTDKIEAHADSATAADEATDDDAMRRTAVVASAVADTNDAMEGPAVSSEADDDSLADDSTDAAAAATDDNATHRAAAAAAAVVFDEDEAKIDLTATAQADDGSSKDDSRTADASAAVAFDEDEANIGPTVASVADEGSSEGDSADAADEATDDDAAGRTPDASAAVVFDEDVARFGPAAASEADDDSLADDDSAAVMNEATHDDAIRMAAVADTDDATESPTVMTAPGGASPDDSLDAAEETTDDHAIRRAAVAAAAFLDTDDATEDPAFATLDDSPSSATIDATGRSPQTGEEASVFAAEIAAAETVGDETTPMLADQPLDEAQIEAAGAMLPADMERPDDLCRIEGIGRSRRRAFYNAGIFTFYQLGQLTAEEVRDIVNVGAAEEWPARARALAERYGREGAEYHGPAPDNLTSVRGIGPSTMQLLYRHGIWRFEQLAELSPEDLEKILPAANISPDEHRQWLALAKELAEQAGES